MTKQNDRWFDQSDFTPEHDKIFLELMDEESLKYWINIILSRKKLDMCEIKIINISGEPALSGYPDVFPDIIITGKLVMNHMNDNIISKIDESGYPTINYKCSKCKREANIRYDKYTTQIDTPEEKNKYEIWKKLHYREDMRWNNECPCDSIKILIEIKPKIDSIGSILRQIKIYQQRMKDYSEDIKIYTLFTTDKSIDKNKYLELIKLLLSQNIIFIHMNGDIFNENQHDTTN